MLVEALAVLVLVIRLLPFIVLPARRRSSHWLVQRGAWAGSHPSSLLVTYLFPVAVSFSSKWRQHSMIHSMFLQDAQVCSSRMSYDVRRGVPLKSAGYFRDVQAFIAMLLFSGSSVFFPTDFVILITFALFNTVAIVALEIRECKWRGSRTLQLATEQSELVAEHMKAEAEQVADHPYFTASSAAVGMAARCKYLVNLLDGHSQLHHAVPPSYRLRAHGADAHRRWITVRDVWRSDLGVRSCARRSLIRDSCLSLAFARLITRRYYGIPCTEENDPNIRDFVLRELLSEEDDYMRAFRIVEVELNFLHDYFHFSEYYHGIDHTFKTSACRLAFLLLFVPCMEYGDQLFGVSWNNEDTATARPPPLTDSVTLLVSLVILAIPELLWLMSHSASHWSEVSYASHYIDGHFWKASIIKWCIDHLERFSLYKHQHWQNKIGQFSLLEDFDRYPGKPLQHSMIGLHDDVKRAVGRALVRSEGRLTNGVSSLGRNGVLDMFSWACTQQHPTHEIVLIWHIATSYCEISEASSRGTDGEDDQGQQRCHFDVARNLSRYCAYLVAFAPKFLPGDSSEATVKLKEAIVEAEQLLGRSTSRRDKYDKLRSLELPGGGTETMLRNGVELGRMLSEEVPSSRRRWEVLADLWAEVMLHVAPSDDANHHVEHLARGGEFVTHLWALLSNAGILERDQLRADC